MLKHVAIYARLNGAAEEVLEQLRQPVEHRGDTVVATYVDDARMTGRGKYAGWRGLIANLDTVDQVVLAKAGDLPGKQVADLLKTLSMLRDHSVGLYLDAEGIDTSSTSFALLDIIAEYRRAKLSDAIRAGHARAVAAGRRIGRPNVPVGVQDCIRTALAEGCGIRPTARIFNVSPASVINIRRSARAVQTSS